MKMLRNERQRWKENNYDDIATTAANGDPRNPRELPLLFLTIILILYIQLYIP